MLVLVPPTLPPVHCTEPAIWLYLMFLFSAGYDPCTGGRVLELHGSVGASLPTGGPTPSVSAVPMRANDAKHAHDGLKVGK